MFTKLTSSLVFGLTLCACVTPEDCDPNTVGNVLTSAACTQTGSFDARLDNLATNQDTILAEVERERIAVSEANTRIRSLQANAQLSQSQLAQINGQIAALQRDIDQLSQSQPQSAQAAAARARIAERRAAINAVADVVVF